MLKVSILIVSTILGILGIATSAETEGEERKVEDTVRHELIYPHPEGKDLSVEQVKELKEPEIERVNKLIAERKAEEERLRKEEEAKKIAQAEAEAEAKRKAEEEAKAIAQAKAEEEAKRVAAEEEAKAEAKRIAEAEAKAAEEEAKAVAQAEKEKQEQEEEKQVTTSTTSQGNQPATSYLLAQLVESEATGEPYTGKVAVAEVVLNRVNDGGFPNSIEGVIYQPGQFQVVSNGRINMTPTQESINASNEALAGSNHTYGALYFYNASTATNRWQDSLRTTTVIGSHTFNAKN